MTRPQIPFGHQMDRLVKTRMEGWIVPERSRGLGDDIAKAIHWITRGWLKPCGGCRKRQAWLNRLLPYYKE